MTSTAVIVAVGTAASTSVGVAAVAVNVGDASFVQSLSPHLLLMILPAV